MVNVNCLNNIASVGLDLFSDDYNTESSFEDAQAVLVRSAKMHDMELGDNLLAIARAGAGVNNIPLDKCAESGIVVFNTPGANANAVKEQVLAAMLLASRDLIGGNEWVKANKDDADIAKATEKAKKAFAGQEIKGKKLGVIGLGAIGQLVANAAIALGMEVYGYDPYLSVNAAWNLSSEVKHIVNVEDIYKECNYITVHVPALDSTAMNSLTSLYEKCQKKKITLILSHVNDQPMRVIRKAGFDTLIGKENFSPNIDAAIEKAEKITSNR